MELAPYPLPVNKVAALASLPPIAYGGKVSSSFPAGSVIDMGHSLPQNRDERGQHLKKETVVSALISAGISAGAYFISGPKVAGLAAGVCAAATILVQVFWKEHKESSPVPAGNTVEQSLSNVGNPIQTVNQHFNLYPPEPAAKQETLPVSEKQQEVRPNIQFVRTKNIRVTVGGAKGDDLVEIVRDIDSDNPQAVVAYFRNTAVSGVAIPDAHKIYAQVLYRDEFGTEIDDVARAYWLDPYRNHAALLLNETHGLILMLMLSDKSLLTSDGTLQKGFRVGQITTIEVVLTYKNSIICSERFDFSDSDGVIDASCIA